MLTLAAQPQDLAAPFSGWRRAGALTVAPPVIPSARALAAATRQRLLAAAAEIRACERELRAGGATVVGAVLKEAGPPVEFEHYPEGDVFDADSGAQYYYHAHRAGEHGHFHTFVRPGGGNDEPTHLIAISMDAAGRPLALFATNRWVTGEAWRAAGEVIALLDAFTIGHDFPSRLANRWMGALLVLFRPHIEALLWHRDAVVAARRATSFDVLEDRALEVTGTVPVSLDGWIAELRRAERERRQ